MSKFITISLLTAGLVALISFTSSSVADEAAKTGLVIPEAKQPTGFPKPGAVGAIVIKEYPAYRAARVAAPDAGRNGMFRSLFNHIKRNEIAMTAPVEMTYNKRGPETMAFLYRDVSIGKTGRDESVDVIDLPGKNYVSVAVRGSYTQQRFNASRGELETWIEKQEEWKAAGPARYLAFNSPFVPGMLKYGEVQIPVTKVETAK